MADSPDRERVVAIVPAFNERERIGHVLQTLSACPEFERVIVVDDGSKDGTADEAARFGVQVIRLEENVGKARAMEIGVEASDAEIVMFCDADLRNLTPEIVREILKPVLAGETDMMVGMHGRAIYEKEFVLSVTPLLGGLRAVRRTLWDAVPAKYKQGFMIEAALNFYARHWGSGYQYGVFGDLKQTIKEKKYGFWRGLGARMMMQGHVFGSWLWLQFTSAPKALRRARLAAVNLVGGLAIVSIGLIIVFASYSGPVRFLQEVFAEEIAKGPAETPIITVLLQIAATASADLLATIGLFIAGFGVLMMVMNMKYTRYLVKYEAGAVERIK